MSQSARAARVEQKALDLIRIGGAAVALIALILVVLTAVGRVEAKGVDFAILLGVAVAGFLMPNLRSISFGTSGLAVGVEGARTAAEDSRAASAEFATQVEQRLAALDHRITHLTKLVEASLGHAAAPAARDASAVNLPRTETSPPAPIFELPPPKVSNDPQKGRFGGAEHANGRRLQADVAPSKLREGWCQVTLAVIPERGEAPIKVPVHFFLHDTFNPDTYVVTPINGRAELVVTAWGAFTAGAALLEGAGEKRQETRLELDLAESPSVDAPKEWRRR